MRSAQIKCSLQESRDVSATSADVSATSADVTSTSADVTAADLSALEQKMNLRSDLR